MDTIRRQAIRARRRLNIQRFLRTAPWTLFAGLWGAALALAVPKIWVMELDEAGWVAGWLGGCLVASLLAAVLWTIIARSSTLEAAIEIDRRYGLKERVSSALALRPAEADSAAGRALVDDAARRVEAIEIREAFGVRVAWLALLPLVPATVAFVLVFLVPDAAREKATAAPRDALVRQQVQRSVQQLDHKLAKRQEELERRGLEEADEIFKQLRQGVEELTRRGDVDRKQALVKLNDLSGQLADRRRGLGDPEQIKRQFERLANLERGPAERVAEALQRGDVDKALQEIKSLLEQIQKGALTKEQKEQLVKQLVDIERRLREAAESQRRAKDELARQIQQKRAEGDQEAVGRLQRKLDQLRQQDAAMQRTQQLASQFGKASEHLRNGDNRGAGAQLDELASQLRDLRDDLSKLETLDDLMSEIAEAKNAMSCQNCDGEGCAACQGGMSASADGGGSGDGLSEGQGQGDRPEQKTKTGFYESRVRAKPTAGEAVRVGDALGPNRPGLSQQQVREEITRVLGEEAEPLTDQRLPRSQQEHVRQYYRRLGDGK